MLSLKQRTDLKKATKECKIISFEKEAGLAYSNSLINKKSHTCEVGGTHLRISNFHLFMNLKSNYFLGFNYIQTNIFITTTSYHNICAIFNTVTIKVVESEKP